MCYKCVDRVTKLKQNHRRSNETTTAVNSTRNNEATTKNDVCNNSYDRSMFSEMLSTLNKMDEKINQLNRSNDEIRQHIPTVNLVDQNGNMSEFPTINQSVINLHAKVDHGIKIQSELETRNSSLMMDKLNEILSKIHVPPSFHATSSKSNETTSHSTLKKHPNKSSCSTDPFNWSFSFNQSILPNDNSDLYQLLHGFEQNTWTSFDYLCRKLSEQTDSILHVESVCKELNGKNTTQQLRSPVTDSIALDNLQQINEKCDNMERNLLEIKSDVKILHTDSAIDDPLTQQLRTRFLTRIISDADINSDGHTLNDLSRYPVIEELLQIDPLSSTDNTHKDNAKNDRHEHDSYDNEPRNATSSFPFTNRFPSIDPVQPKTSSNPLDVNGTAMKSLHLLGGNVNASTLNKHLHISPFDITITSDSIIDYITNNARVNKKRIKIRRLTKKGQDLSELRYVNFKIETDDETSDIIMRQNFWPSHIRIKPWTVKNEAPVYTPSFLCNKTT